MPSQYRYKIQYSDYNFNIILQFAASSPSSQKRKIRRGESALALMNLALIAYSFGGMGMIKVRLSNFGRAPNILDIFLIPTGSKIVSRTTPTSKESGSGCYGQLSVPASGMYEVQI